MAEGQFWSGKRVFVTGHSGFKGGWLCLWLYHLGATVFGYALQAPTTPSFYQVCGIDRLVHSVHGDVRDAEKLTAAMLAADPEIVMHLAAQSLVRKSYRDPVETYATNVMGTINLLEGVRICPRVRAAVIVTSDKCYENREWLWGYRENEPLGGYEPYSSSKACAELVTAAYRNCYFNPSPDRKWRPAVASARAGNVIGGGDWAADRLVPDCIRAFSDGQTVVVRNPDAIRPWQHVLEPLNGYLTLAQKLYAGGPEYGEAWNFGPEDADAKPVRWVVQELCRLWGHNADYRIDTCQHVHEAGQLKLDCSKAKARLAWRPVLGLAEALEKVVEWSSAAHQGEADMRMMSLQQICDFEKRI